MGALIFEQVERSQRQLVLRYRFDELCFSTSYWYDTVDFDDLVERYGEPFMRLVEFHILAFEANKAASLKPDSVDFGPYSDLATDEFWSLWETIFRNTWGVWRYENNLPDFRLTRPASGGVGAVPEPVTIESGEVAVLMMCGGGKDSLASMELLDGAGIEYDAFVYSHSTYGRGDHQHDLIDGLLAHCAHRKLRRGWVIDDAIDSPAALVHPEFGIGRMIAAETVSSYWTALPVVLQHGYTKVAFGITRSTDEHNLDWDETGEEINYLWGMSGEAEDLLHDYIARHIVGGLDMFHILRPIYDIGVFALLNRRLDAVPSTHSCAQLKPWCGRCAKCIYVWMNYMAWLPESVVRATIADNLFDRPENRTTLRKMLGLESYKPTDCVGTVSEARLAFLMCRRKGVTGLIADDIDVEPFAAESNETLRHYGSVWPACSPFPPEIAARIMPQLELIDAEAIAASVL